MSINCADGFNGITTWDCSRSTSTNLKCTGNCTDCALMCMAPTQISWERVSYTPGTNASESQSETQGIEVIGS
ncbi:hypothetical protein RCL_jg16250.t1 [Rhizophagus clarus]|uniref:Uncharacterized protein n=1 Tax=Rhizophagus clarus TaxID=94130 RepID=A0A8H3M3F8_9GLOM|nr:hypothetical protein RCL_jg16250.t1 [Rhizophagus clarus]